MNQRTLVIELNEFNPELLSQAASEFGLENVRSFLSWRHTKTRADHEVEHEGLDPWCQWISIHTETPSSTHQIVRLGDADKLRHSQIWERLGALGLTTGVWGAMNAKRNATSSCLFFAPDPWNFTEEPHPPQLGKFFALPVYYSKHYMDLSGRKLLLSGLRTCAAILKEIPLAQILADGLFLLRKATTARPGTYILFGAFELLSTRLFLKYYRRDNPDVAFVFLNLVAHYQHHEWRARAALDRRAYALFSIADRILGMLMRAVANEERVLVMNAFTQRNVELESQYCYRQINPLLFLQALALKPLRVEQCMTNDGHVFFASAADRDQAARCLAAARVGTEHAFEVEADSREPTRLFYRFAYWGPASVSTILEIAGQRIPLFSVFRLHAKRTGAHVPEGDVYARGVSLPSSLMNYQVFGSVWPGGTGRPPIAERCK